MKHVKELMLAERLTNHRPVVLFAYHYNEFVRLSFGRVESLP